MLQSITVALVVLIILLVALAIE